MARGALYIFALGSLCTGGTAASSGTCPAGVEGRGTGVSLAQLWRHMAGKWRQQPESSDGTASERELQHAFEQRQSAAPAALGQRRSTGAALRARQRLLAGCGAICNTSELTTSRETLLRKAVDCLALFRNSDEDAPAAVWPPPTAPPLEFLDDFTMGGRAVVKLNSTTGGYFAERTSGTTGGGDNKWAAWTKQGIDDLVAQARSGTLAGGYGFEETSSVLKLMQARAAEFAGKRVLVVGSMTPWLEAILLSLGAKHVTTVEYGELPKEPHPQVSTTTPAELRALFLAGKVRSFEAAASYSSIEHSGLGRYGDAVNPWGDLQAAAKVGCVLAPGGAFMIGVPSGPDDEVVWNAHRRYGPHRWPHLMANFQYVESTKPFGLWKQTAALYTKAA